MGLLICAIVVMFITIWSNLASEDYEWVEKSKRAVLAGIASVFVVYGIVAIIINLTTYSDYAKARANYDSVLAQYGQAVKVYENKAVLDVKAIGDTWTDFRFQGYQENMSKMITDLRGSVADYNRYLISRRAWGKNFFVGWYMVMPDKDMKTIDIVNTLPTQK